MAYRVSATTALATGRRPCEHPYVSVEQNVARCADCWTPLRNPLTLPTVAGRLGVLRPGILNPRKRRRG